MHVLYTIWNSLAAPRVVTSRTATFPWRRQHGSAPHADAQRGSEGKTEERARALNKLSNLELRASVLCYEWIGYLFPFKLFTQLNGPISIQWPPFYLNRAIRPRKEGSFQTRRRTSSTGPEVISPSWQISHLYNCKKEKVWSQRSRRFIIKSRTDSVAELGVCPRGWSRLLWRSPAREALQLRRRLHVCEVARPRGVTHRRRSLAQHPQKTCRPRRKCERCWTSLWAPGETVSETPVPCGLFVR